MKIQPPISELHAKVLAVIPEGRGNAEPIQYLMEKLAIQKEDRRKAYSVIHDLIHRYGFCIGGSSDEDTRGVFMVMDEEDLKIACKTLNTRATSLLERSRKIIDNFNKQEQKKTRLDDEGEES